MADTAPDLHELARRLEKLETKPKDSWDKTSVVIAALVPVTIAILSAVVTYQGNRIAAAQVDVADSQVRLAERQYKVQKYASDAKTSIEKAQLLHQYVDILLTKNDPVRKKLAERGVSLGLPREGAELVSELGILQNSAPEVKTTPIPAPRPPRPKVRFPIMVGSDRQIACAGRGGGAACVVAPGVIQTPPPGGGLGIYQTRIPEGTKWLTGTLTEYSGSSCNGGAAIAEIRIDGLTVWREELRETRPHPFKISIPANSRVLELRVDSADPTPFCDDPEWRDMLFRNKL